MPVLQAVGVSLHRGGVHALRDVGMQVSSGEAVGLIGPNGAGKTTMLDVLSGFLRPQSGSVTIDGTDLTGLRAWKNARHGIHRTFQGSRLFADLSVAENITVAARSAGVSERAAREQAASLMMSLHLHDLRELRCRGLPHGVTQRIVLARALATRPRFLLLDEPAAGLSEVETAEFERLVAEARSEGTGVLLVEHDMRFVEAVCERTYVLNDGLLLFEGAVKDAFADATVQSAYLGAPESAVG